MCTCVFRRFFILSFILSWATLKQTHGYNTWLHTGDSLAYTQTQAQAQVQTQVQTQTQAYKDTDTVTDKHICAIN